MTSLLEGGSWKSRQNNKIREVAGVYSIYQVAQCDKWGRGLKKSKDYADILYGSPLIWRVVLPPPAPPPRCCLVLCGSRTSCTFLKKAFCCDNVWVGSHSSKDPHTQKMPLGLYLTLKWMAARKVLAKFFVAKTVRIAYNVHTRWPFKLFLGFW